MKQRWKNLVGFLLPVLLPALFVTVAYGDLFDPCVTTAGPGNYQGLSAPGQDYISWEVPPDDTYLCQQSNRRAASAVYYCPGAREVTVALYSRYGSFAGGGGDSLIRGGDEQPLYYHPSSGEVYCGDRRMVYDAELGEFVFLEPEGRPSDLERYGLSVFSSEDGRDYTRASVRLVSAEREGSDAYWYEVYRVELEESARCLRLTLTDQSSIEIAGREERYQFETVGGLSLASVEIIGEEEEPAPGESQDPAEDREPEEEEPEEDEDQGGSRWDDEELWNGWEEEESWEIGEIETEGSEGTDTLPSYRPGEEEGPEDLPWGPGSGEDGEAAFPEETEELPEEEPSSGEESPAASGEGRESEGAKTSGKAKSGGGSQIASEKPVPEGKRVTPGEPGDALRRGVPLWRRVLEPEGMTLLILSVCMLVTGIRILWIEGGDGRDRRRRGTRQEEQYARYTSSGPRSSGRKRRWEERHPGIPSGRAEDRYLWEKLDEEEEEEKEWYL